MRFKPRSPESIVMCSANWAISDLTDCYSSLDWYVTQSENNQMLLSNCYEPMVLLYLNCSWHTDLDYCSYYLLDLEIGLRKGVIGGHGMLTPPTHLVPHLVHPEVHVYAILWFLFLYWWDWWLFLMYAILCIIFADYHPF
jgi:hypothetical protein